MSILPIRRSAGNHDVARPPKRACSAAGRTSAGPGPTGAPPSGAARGLPPELRPARWTRLAALVTDTPSGWPRPCGRRWKDGSAS